MTGREVVSEIRSMHKLLSADSLINDRTILAEAKSSANMIVKQSTDKRKLWQSPNLFAFLPCLEMEEAPLGECCDYTSETLISKSKEKLPQIGEGIFGLLIQQVTNVENMVKFKEVTPIRYANILKLKLKTNDIFFWILNDHLYVSNAETKRVNMFLYPTGDVPNHLLFPGEDCNCKSKPDIDDLCINPLDKKFYFPADRIDDLKTLVSRKLLQTYFNLPTDKTSDNKDDQSK